MKSKLSAALFLATAAVLPVPASADGHLEAIVTSQYSFALRSIATGLEHPWGLDWLPDGRIAVTERPGRLRLVAADGSLSEPVAGLPEIVSEFRDGLLDVAVSPDFAEDATLFLAYSKKDGAQRWLEIISGRLDGLALEDVTTIFAAGVKVEKDQGFGSRIRFDAAGNMLVSVGDHAVVQEAQNPANTLGSIIRIKTDGTPANGNPRDGLHPAIFAHGFKNPQGLAIDPATGDIWAADHGGVGGGEINQVRIGGNYGWPVRSFGGGDRPGATSNESFVEPLFTWGAAPTVALSGLEIYSGADFPGWRGDLFVGSLMQEAVIRVMRSEAGHVVGTERIVDQEIGRIREVRQGPDGRLYVLNDDPEGGIYRIDPVR